MHQGYILKVIEETSTMTRVYEAVQNQIWYWEFLSEAEGTNFGSICYFIVETYTDAFTK